MQRQPPSSFQQGLSAAESGEFERAHAIARSLLSSNPDDVYGLQILGFAAFRQGDNQRALEAFWRANRIEPGQPTLLCWLGVLYRERGDFAQAERAFRDAVRINPRDGDAWCQFGETLYVLGRKDEARDAFDRALAAAPVSAAVLAKSARFFEMVHDLNKARALAEQARSLNPNDELTAIALAELDLREKKYGDALANLSPLVDNENSNFRYKAKTLHMIATAYDKLGRFDEAFASLEQAHALQKSAHSARIASGQSPLNSDTIARTRAFLETADLAKWTRFDRLDGPSPIFLLGFVRSGTTWLDQILSSHPKIAVMEEEDNFIDIWPHLIMSDNDLHRLPDLSRDEVNGWRRKYWDRARQSIKHPDAQFVVDKVPLNTAQLGLIYRLFPEAKIIFALRDPRDCVLSAFQQNFQLNAGMFHFLEIKAAAIFYDNVMAIGEIIRNRTPLRFHEVRYEDAVADLESEMRRLIDFIGAPWTSAVLDYQTTATQRAIRTPSRQQVVHAPYASSIGKWRNYRKGMSPALEILAPWVAKFGYESD